MKSIVIFCRAYPPHIGGGGEISTRMLAEELSAFGYRVTVVAISNVKKNIQDKGIDIYRIPYKNVYWSLESSDNKLVKFLWHCIDANNFFIKKQLEDILEKFNPSVIITSTIEDVSSIVWKIASNKKIQVIHILRSYSLLCVNANMFKKDNCEKQCGSCKLLTYPKKINSKYVTDIVGISDFVLKEHLRYNYFPNAKQHVIYNMCLDDTTQHKTYDGHVQNELRIGYIGRIHKTKGIELLLYAVSCITDEELRSNIKIMIAGEGDPEYLELLRKTANEMSVNAIFLGNTNSSHFLDSIDLLVVPSLWKEPFGRVVIESMGRKVPVAGKTTGGIPELLNNNDSFLFESSHQLTELIVKYFNGEIEFKFDMKRFETEEIVSKWESILS